MLKLIPGSMEAAKVITSMDLDSADIPLVAKIITKHCGTYELREVLRKQSAQSYDRLYSAVQDYIEKNGGCLSVIGGVEIQDWPQDSKGSFRLAIRCCGIKPTFKSK